MKDRHTQDWERLRDRQKIEREEAGLRPALSAKSREQDNRAAERHEPDRQAEALRAERLRDGITRAEQIDRQKHSPHGDRPLSEATKEKVRRMQEREREERERGNDYGRER